jgi:signal transduction histidine kinase
MNQLKFFDHIFDSAIGINQKGEIVYFNNQASIFFKLPPRLLKQKKALKEIVDTRDFDIKGWTNKSLLSHEVLISPEIRLNLLHEMDNEYSVVLKLIPLEMDVESMFIILFQDKTVERNLHLKYREQVEELKRTHNQILQADKLTTLGELTANISHEINNPLTIAAGHTELIQDYLKSKVPESKIEKIKEANHIVFESLQRVNQIIKNMKDFLHQNEDKKEYCDLEEVLDAAAEWVSPVATKANIVINREFAGQKIAALANRIKLEQVIINLMKNSVDAIKEENQSDGKIEIKVSKSDSEQQTIIDIIDNGPGLSEEIKKNLFKPFMTTKDAGRGTGLGLSICAQIVETHQGKLEHIESNTGCHFRLKLPLIEIYSYTRNDKFLSGEVKQKRILVLDNEVQVLNILNAYIQDEGLVFIGSSDPLDALEFLSKAEIDLIITDFSMPGMNGREFSEKAREYGYTGPILYMTSAKFIEQYNKDKQDLEIDGIIIKPFNREDVIKTIKSSLEECE